MARALTAPLFRAAPGCRNLERCEGGFGLISMRSDLGGGWRERLALALPNSVRGAKRDTAIVSEQDSRESSYEGKGPKNRG